MLLIDCVIVRVKRGRGLKNPKVLQTSFLDSLLDGPSRRRHFTMLIRAARRGREEGRREESLHLHSTRPQLTRLRLSALQGCWAVSFDSKFLSVPLSMLQVAAPRICFGDLSPLPSCLLGPIHNKPRKGFPFCCRGADKMIGGRVTAAYISPDRISSRKRFFVAAFPCSNASPFALFLRSHSVLGI